MDPVLLATDAPNSPNNMTRNTLEPQPSNSGGGTGPAPTEASPDLTLVLLLWDQLGKLSSEIDEWRFLRDFDELPTIIWELWRHHRAARTINIFNEVIMAEIEVGEGFVRQLKEMLPSCLVDRMDMFEWAEQISDMLGRVREALAQLQFRLELTENGMTEKYPN